MTPVTSPRLPIRLRRDLVAEKIAAFVAVGQDVPHEYWGEENFLRDLPEKWRLSLVCLDDAGAPEGYAIASRPELDLVHLHHLMVRPGLRGTGLGALLLGELLHRAARAGGKRVRLKVHVDNVGALRFYEREGFRRVSSDSDYHVLCASTRSVERRIAIHQPNYLPWCGYFSKWTKADVFVFLDDAQMPGGASYVYRSRVLGPTEGQWMSIPTRRSLSDRISDVEFASTTWGKKHLGTLRALYGRRPFFKPVFEQLEAHYQGPGDKLAPFNARMIRAIAGLLGSCRPVFSSSQFGVEDLSDERLVKLVEELGGTVYLSGKGGQNYQNPEKFELAAIQLEMHAYQPVPYDQGRAEFEPGLSVVDALFNIGPERTVQLL
jgi:ribosomal protein S18 acetylase RimI-like enzyme